jgi:hypothetical protein
MIQATNQKPQRIGKFLVMPIACALILVGAIFWGSALTKGNDLVAIYKFTHFLNTGLFVLFPVVFFSIIFTVGWVRDDDRKTLLVFANLAVMFGLFGIGIFGVTTWDNKPQAALATINAELEPVVEQFFAAGPFKPQTTNKNPLTPYKILEADMSKDADGNYLFSKPQVSEDPLANKDTDANNYPNTYAQNLHLLEIYQSGGELESYKSLAVIVRQWVKTGRTIPLDRGTAPELREQVNIYIVDVSTWQVVAENKPILGGRAQRPIGGPGVGTIYIDELRGKEVEFKTIRKYLDNLTWE